MKKMLALLLTAIMVFTLAGCSGGTTSTGSTAPGGSQAASGADGEIVTVKLTVPTMNNMPSDEAKQQVADALSAYIQEKGYNIAIALDFISIVDYTTDMNMRLAGNEEQDVIFAGMDLNTAVTNGYLINLDPYVDNELKGAMDVLGDWNLCGMVGGSQYAIPAKKGLSLDYKYIYNAELFKDFDMTKIKSINDLPALFAEFKEAYPNEYPATDAYNTALTLFSQEDHTAIVGTHFATVGDSTQLVNLYETEAYKKACDTAYDWRQKGYVDPEGSAQTLTHDVLSQTGACKGVIMGHSYSIPTIEAMFDMNNTYGATFNAVSIGNSLLSSNTLNYGVAYTSKHPKEAVEVLNLIWTDEFVMSTIIYGLEGVSWEWNEAHTSIQYPEGLGLDSVPYTALFTCGAFGNQFNLYGMDGNTSEDDKVYMEELNNTAWVAPLFGFTPSSENVSTQVAAVSNVVTQYDKALRYGDVDPATVLPEFQAALKDAGIDDIMADYQSQVDDWLATYKS